MWYKDLQVLFVHLVVLSQWKKMFRRSRRSFIGGKNVHWLHLNRLHRWRWDCLLLASYTKQRLLMSQSKDLGHVVNICYEHADIPLLIVATESSTLMLYVHSLAAIAALLARSYLFSWSSSIPGNLNVKCLLLSLFYCVLISISVKLVR